MTFRWVAVGAAVLQLTGTALIVWGLRIKSSETAWEVKHGQERPHATVHKAHPCAFAVGVILLLLGLALQVVAAVL
jgi:hypothetical protein